MDVFCFSNHYRESIPGLVKELKKNYPFICYFR